MKVLRFVIFIALLIGLFVGCDKIVNSCGTDFENGVDISSDLDPHLNYIQACAEKVGDGWNTQYLDGARIYIEKVKKNITDAECSILTDKLRGSFVEELHKRLTSDYNPAMAAVSAGGNTVLGRDFGGLDTLVSLYPEVKNSNHWIYLNGLRKTHEDIYNFSRRSFALSPCVNPSLVWSSNEPTLRWKNPHSFEAYVSGPRAAQARLINSRAEYAELSALRWMNDPLNPGVLNNKLNDCWREYHTKEMGHINSFLKSFVSDYSRAYKSRYDSSRASMDPNYDLEWKRRHREVYNKLVSFENEMNNHNATVELKKNLKDVRAQFSRIYLENI